MRRTSGNMASARGGFTLIELLVVIIIISIAAVAVLTQARPAVEKRRIREAARQLTTALARAKAHAMQTGRPYGVWIERFDDGARPVAFEVHYAEVPPPFAGVTDAAVARITGFGTAQLSDMGSVGNSIQAGDMIRFGYQGPLYQITTPGANCTFTAPDSSIQLPEATVSGAAGLAYQIFRQPRKATAKGIQLPGEAVIDLSQSGPGDMAAGGGGDQGKAFAEMHRVVIMFSPSGALDHIFFAPGTPGVRPTSTVHLLIGKNQKVTDSRNLDDPDNLWVSVGAITGIVSVSPNAGRENGGNPRSLARGHQSLGGR